MKQIGRFALPKKGSEERAMFDAWAEAHQDIAAMNAEIKKIRQRAAANCVLQKENGAGLPADNLLRDFNHDYNYRVFKYSIHDLSSSFNVLEAFNHYIPESS